MSNVKLTIRPLPHKDFVQGWVGVAESENGTRPAAHLAGTVEVNVGPKGVKAQWLRVELRKTEVVPSSAGSNKAGKKHRELIGDGPTELWTARRKSVRETPKDAKVSAAPGKDDAFELLKTKEIAFKIPLPEALPNSVSVDRRTSIGITYDLVATLCAKTKPSGFFSSSSRKPDLLTEAVPISIEKHDTHPDWPIYTYRAEKEDRSVSDHGLTMTVQRSTTAYGPGDSMWVRIRITSTRADPVKLSRIELGLHEYITYRPEQPADAKKENVKVDQRHHLVAAANETLNAILYHQETGTFDVRGLLPREHYRTTIRQAKQIDIEYQMQITAVLERSQQTRAPIGNLVVQHLPCVVGSYERKQASVVIDNILSNGRAPIPYELDNPTKRLDPNPVVNAFDAAQFNLGTPSYPPHHIHSITPTMPDTLAPPRPKPKASQRRSAGPQLASRFVGHGTKKYQPTGHKPPVPASAAHHARDSAMRGVSDPYDLAASMAGRGKQSAYAQAMGNPTKMPRHDPDINPFPAVPTRTTEPVSRAERDRRTVSAPQAMIAPMPTRQLSRPGSLADSLGAQDSDIIRPASRHSTKVIEDAKRRLAERRMTTEPDLARQIVPEHPSAEDEKRRLYDAAKATADRTQNAAGPSAHDRAPSASHGYETAESEKARLYREAVQQRDNPTQDNADSAESEKMRLYNEAVAARSGTGPSLSRPPAFESAEAEKQRLYRNAVSQRDGTSARSSAAPIRFETAEQEKARLYQSAVDRRDGAEPPAPDYSESSSPTSAPSGSAKAEKANVARYYQARESQAGLDSGMTNGLSDSSVTNNPYRQSVTSNGSSTNGSPRTSEKIRTSSLFAPTDAPISEEMKRYLQAVRQRDSFQQSINGGSPSRNQAEPSYPSAAEEKAALSRSIGAAPAQPTQFVQNPHNLASSIPQAGHDLSPVNESTELSSSKLSRRASSVRGPRPARYSSPPLEESAVKQGKRPQQPVALKPPIALAQNGSSRTSSGGRDQARPGRHSQDSSRRSSQESDRPSPTRGKFDRRSPSKPRQSKRA
ncbi:uncharacterized protein L969DRAFT_15670 [Mixia osmundae IAM 14324]|uniref:Arrestin C-terminal-like domain-containing protein n=1 Tax=Mixia osmundae (strain CBS 9802 / IAM 14324 / JCM 22182 / KY 12970) TaxID=764103 RepID=G7DYU1_MIXOS|nr:uncharacterized protein L969DRAFT_15670 [Mixia osmundae IAM 14324]KEI41647.1 hypothetical protein L969DRAFT_15670 [Mixia osmundae IAM 14324]GAA95751.1 hypothetical protein E5Q_02408 [Mixia osmundae IAM 14324]